MTAFFWPGDDGARAGRLSFARLAMAAPSIKAVRSQSLPFRVCPTCTCQRSRCYRDGGRSNWRDGPRSGKRSCQHSLRRQGPDKSGPLSSVARRVAIGCMRRIPPFSCGVCERRAHDLLDQRLQRERRPSVRVELHQGVSRADPPTTGARAL
jgi:hypothetical protein